MAYDDRNDRRGRYWGRETQWRGDQGFGGGWGNQTVRPVAPLGFDADLSGYGFGYDGELEGGPRFGRADAGTVGAFAVRRHDPHYAEWRQRQVDALDRDYDEYRRENQSRFDREFGAWREKRGQQRDAVAKVGEHMEVVGSDGAHVGTVDGTSGDSIILTKGDEGAGGVHHRIPCAWVDRVEDKVVLNLAAEEARERWRTEGRSRALFEREDSGRRGPHILNRSFAGTYSDEE